MKMNEETEPVEEFSVEDVIERLDNIAYQLQRIAAALETIQQTVSPQHLEVSPKVKEEVKKQLWSSYKELAGAIKEKAPTLHENIKNARRFKTGNYLVQIDYVDSATFKKIANEARSLGGEYSKKYRGFIFQGGTA